MVKLSRDKSVYFLLLKAKKKKPVHPACPSRFFPATYACLQLHCPLSFPRALPPLLLPPPLPPPLARRRGKQASSTQNNTKIAFRHVTDAAKQVHQKKLPQLQEDSSSAKERVLAKAASAK
jgi:hypothetical protein